VEVLLHSPVRCRGASLADTLPDAPITLTYQEFADGLDRLQAVGFPMEWSRQEAWRHVRGWRVSYEAAAYLLADRLVACGVRKVVHAGCRYS
jgi:hypothetical protein